MSTQEYDSNFTRQLAQASQWAAAHSPAPADDADPTFDLRRKQANLAEAVMLGVFELEAQAAALTEIAKKLRACVLANT